MILPNLGEKKFLAISSEGVQRGLTMQVCDVNKGLLSVSKIVALGHRVVFDKENGSYIEDTTSGERLWLQERGGMYILRLWVRKAGF